MSALRLVGATARLGGRDVLAGVDLSVTAGELVALVGPNGAGKSSALRALAGLLPLQGGEAWLGDTRVAQLSARQRAERVAYLPQERRIAWNMAAVEIAALGAPFAQRDQALARARAALATVGAEALAERGVADMSGGERARVLLARALVPEAAALLADEPIAGLDPEAQLMVLDLLTARARTGQAVLVSLHDLSLAARHADRIVVLDHGRVVAEGSAGTALNPGVLSDTFGVRGAWVETSDGPLLSLSRIADQGA